LRASAIYALQELVIRYIEKLCFSEVIELIKSCGLLASEASKGRKHLENDTLVLRTRKVFKELTL